MNLHVFLNGLSIYAGGGYIVVRELIRHMAEYRPNWTFTILLIEGFQYHDRLRQELQSTPCQFHLAPQSLTRRFKRVQYERIMVPRLIDDHTADFFIQPNGMIIGTLTCHSIAHFGDAGPYDSSTWPTLRSRIIAHAKRRAHRRSLKYASCCTFTSSYLQHLVCEHHSLTPTRAEIIFNGIPSDWLSRSDATTPDVKQRSNEILTVSTIHHYKGHETVIRALAQLRDDAGFRLPRYRIIGLHFNRRHANYLMSLTKQLGLNDFVCFEGHIPHSELPTAYERARCFVLMSKCESFGIPAIEAMSFGLPVIASRTCALPEICGDACDFVTVDDVTMLAGTIRRVMTDDLHANSLRKNGFNNVKRFSWNESAMKMANLIESIAEKRA